jgi:nitrite reductase/ring-hydroxylating ferredoxin subunit
MLDSSWQPLCASTDLQNGGRAVLFDIRYGGQTCLGFAVRHEGAVTAYVNRCAHVAMEMDWRPGHFFDESGRWLMCATHGALFEPANGQCVAGPCVGRSLISISCSEQNGVVYWQTAHNLEAVVF